MNQPVFPSKRPDGSFSVAARFSVRDAGALKLAGERVAEWLDGKVVSDSVDLSADFLRPVRIVPAGEGHFDVVFDCQPHSVMWKGWLIELTQEVRWLEGITFQGFWDLVAGAPHPASVLEEPLAD